MNKLGTYQNREVYWANYPDLLNDELPSSDWICMLTSSEVKPDADKFDQFTRKTIKNGILEFKGHGKFGELLHDWFDGTMVIMETMDKHPEIETMTTWHNDETLADVFWQCFFATCLPETTNLEKVKILCSDLDGIDRTKELQDYMIQFNKGWIPKE